MKKLCLLVGILFIGTGCSHEGNNKKTEATNKTSEVVEVFTAAVEELENAHIYQVLRNGTAQSQGMFIFENGQLRVYKTYLPPNPDLSPEKLKEEQAKIVEELGLNDFSEFEEVSEINYDNVTITTNGNVFYLAVAGKTYELTKIGPKRLKDQLGVEYEIR